MVKRIIAGLLLLVMVLAFVACDSESGDGSVTKLSFKSTNSFEYLKSLEGTMVSINGYMATSSPVDGSFIFLMNLPYQSCPFCKPKTAQLSNTMEVYPKDKKAFDYTTQAIKVVGKLAVTKTADDFFTDNYGYQFNFKIVDAEYTILDSDELSAEMALWQKLAQADIISDIYKMYDYVNFVCAWPTYFVNSFTDANGNLQKGYYLYPTDALDHYLKPDKGQYHYGYVEGYFNKIISRITKIDPNAFSALVENVQKAQDLAARALADLEAGKYTYEKKYVEKFDNTDYVYTLTNGEQFASEMEELYLSFSNWLAAWEL